MEGTPASPATDVQVGFAESQLPPAGGSFNNTTIAGNWGAGSVVPPSTSIHDASGTFDLNSGVAFLAIVDETEFSSPFEIPDFAIGGGYGPTSANGRAATTIPTIIMGTRISAVIWAVSANRLVLLAGTDAGNTKPQVSIFDRQ